jgi:hypothetical protein
MSRKWTLVEMGTFGFKPNLILNTLRSTSESSHPDTRTPISPTTHTLELFGESGVKDAVLNFIFLIFKLQKDYKEIIN